MDGAVNLRWRQSAAAGLCCALLGAGWWLLPHPLLALAAGLLPLAALLALRLPFWVVLAFVAFSFFRIHEVLPALNPLRLPQLLALGALAVFAWHSLISRELQPFWSRELTLLSLFFALVTLGVPLAGNVAEAKAAWTGSYSKIYLMSLATCWLTRREADFALAGRVFVACGLLVAAVAVSNKLNGIGLVEGSRVTIGRELGSLLGDPNDLALVLLFPASFALGAALEVRLGRLERFFGLLVFVAVSWAVVATQSRGGLLGILAVSGVFAWQRMRNKALLVGLAVPALLLLFALAGISDRSSGGATEEGIDASAMGRLYAWGAAWGMALDNPLFGVGLRNFYFNYYFYSSHWDGLNHAVHSTWFGVLAETGFLGLGMFVATLACTLRRVWRQATHPDNALLPPGVACSLRATCAGLVGFAVSGTFLTQGFTWPAYLLVALAVAAMRFAEQTRSTSQAALQNAKETP